MAAATDTVRDRIDEHRTPSFEVVVEQVIGTVEVGSKPGKPPMVVAFEMIGRNVHESRHTDSLPRRYSFGYADETFTVVVDTKEGA